VRLAPDISTSPGMEVGERSWLPDVDPGPRFWSPGEARKLIARPGAPSRCRSKGRILPGACRDLHRGFNRCLPPTRSQQACTGWMLGYGQDGLGRPAHRRNGWFLKENAPTPHLPYLCVLTHMLLYSSLWGLSVDLLCCSDSGRSGDWSFISLARVVSLACYYLALRREFGLVAEQAEGGGGWSNPQFGGVRKRPGRQGRRGCVGSLWPMRLPSER